MTATGQNFTIRQGEDKVLRFACTDADNTVDGVAQPLDVSGADLRFQVGYDQATLTTASGDIGTADDDGDGVSETAVVTVTGTESATWSTGDHFVQLRAIDAAGKTSYLAEGHVTVKASIP